MTKLRITIMYVDYSAAIRIAKKRGAGWMRHINICVLWIQEKAEDETVTIQQVNSISNPTDMMTKAVDKETLDKYVVMTKQRKREGRAKEGLKVRRTVQANSHDVGRIKGGRGRFGTVCILSKEERKAP